jgi:hypothetical protein
MNDSHPHTPDLIFTAAVAAAQRAAADSVSAAVLAAERRGYERGLAEARQAAAAAPARLPDDAVEALRRALREIERGVEVLEGYDPSSDVDLDLSSCEEIEVPGTDEPLSDVQEFCDSYGGSTLIDKDSVAIDSSAVEAAIEQRCGILRRALRGVRDLLT